MSLSPDRIVADLKGFVSESYPDMEISAAPWEHDPSRLAIRFTEAKFALLYPQQRWHYLHHLIPQDYHKAHLENTLWIELAPGERPEDLRYPDEELIEEILPHVMKCVKGSRFFEALDDVLCPLDPQAERAECWGDFRHARPALLRRGFTEDELFDVFHVLMHRGGYCDCEILLNVAEESRLKSEHWKSRARKAESLDPPADG